MRNIRSDIAIVTGILLDWRVGPRFQHSCDTARTEVPTKLALAFSLDTRMVSGVPKEGTLL